MSNEELLSKIRQCLEQINTAGCNFGKIELIVKNGEIKHINLSYEILRESLINSGEDERTVPLVPRENRPRTSINQCFLRK